MNGYPDLFRAFPFERRPEQTLAAFAGINSSPAWSPDGRTLALTLSKDGNPEIYVLTLATGVFRRLTRHAGIDTDPSWSPSGQEIAFVSDRPGRPHIFVMDDEGANVRQLTSGGFHTQPRWSPRGDTIIFTHARRARTTSGRSAPDGSNPRRSRSGPGDNQGAAWAPNGRHIAFQSNRTGRGRSSSCSADGASTTPVTQGTSESHKSLMVASPAVIGLGPRSRRTSWRGQRRSHGEPCVCDVVFSLLLVLTVIISRLRQAARDHSGLSARPSAGARARRPGASQRVDQRWAPRRPVAPPRRGADRPLPAAGAAGGAGSPRLPRPLAQGLRGRARPQGHLLRVRQVRYPARGRKTLDANATWLKANAEHARADRGALRRARHQRVQPGARRAAGEGDDELSRLAGRAGEPHHHHQLR